MPTMKKAVLIFLLVSVVLTSCNLPTARTPGVPTGATELPVQVQFGADAVEIALNWQAISIISPANGDAYPFLTALPVLVSTISGEAGIVAQELLVNGEMVQTQRGDEISPAMYWLANLPGRNTLQARAQTADGKTLLSEPVEIHISPEPVGFDILAQTQGGETLAGLAGQYGLDPQTVTGYNPGVVSGLNDPLPAGLLIRLPVASVISPEVLAQAAPGLATPSGTGASSPVGEASPFAPPLAPGFDLNLPPIFDRVYYYLSLNSGPWSRVPRLLDEFITPAQGFFNLDEALQGAVAPPSQGTLRAEIDAWGWSGGALVYIGRFEKIFITEEGREPFAILPGQLEICALSSPNCAQGFSTFGGDTLSNFGGKYELRWSPPPSAQGGVWQVSRFPFDSACSPNPAGMFLSGGVNVGGAQAAFSVDFPAPGQDVYSIPIIQPGVGNVSLSSAWFPQTYYVRVLPVFDGAVKCVPSNAVTLTVDPNQQGVSILTPTPQPAAPAPPVLFDVEIVEFTPIQFPDGKFTHCVVVVENPFYEQQNQIVDGWLAGEIYKNIAPGTMLCPQPYVYKEPPFIEKAGQFLTDAINTISKAYEILKQLAIQLVVKAIPYCYASEFIDAYKEEIDSVCNAAAEVIVSAALTYVGLPPSIPNYEQLKDTAKGKITDLAVQQLEEQTGLPCIEICQDFVRERVDEVWSAGESLLTSKPSACIDEKSAHNQGFEPLCLPGNIKTVPEPRGLLLPAQAQVRVTRRTDAPDSTLPNSLLFKTTCDLTISNSAVNNAYAGQSIFIGQNHKTGGLEYWQGETLYAQNLFSPEKLTIQFSNLPPGNSKDFHLALQPRQGTFPPNGSSTLWLPGRLKLYQNYWNDNWAPANWLAHDDWHYYYLGAELTVTATASCTTRPNSLQELQPSTSADSDVWVEQIPAEKLP
jgi:hypothetical protein